MKWALEGKNYILVLICVGLLVFFNGTFGQFIWDDKIYIIGNPELREFNIVKLFGENIFNKAVYYRPIPAVYFSALVNFFGTQTFFYHITQILIHILNSILVFVILKEFFRRKLSFLLSVIFLVHPVQVESVSYIAASVSPIFTLFGLSALISLIKLRVSRLKLGALLTLLFLASILTKETGIIFCVLCILYAYLYKKNLLRVTFFSSILSLIFYFLLRFGVGRVFFDKSLVLPLPMMEMPFIERLFHIPAIIFSYLSVFFFPWVLSSNQHWVIINISFVNFWLPLFCVALGVLALVLLGHRTYQKTLWNPYLFFTAWFVLGLAPHLQIVPLDMTVAERWFYLPVVGLLGIIGVAISSIEHKKRAIKTIYIGLGIIIVLLSMRTMARNIDWQSPLYLYSHDLKNDPDNFDMQNNLGNEMFLIGDLKNAELHFEESIKLSPTQSINFTNLATVYAAKKEYKQAFLYYDKAITNNPDYYPAYEKLAFVYLKMKKYDEAISFLGKAINKFQKQPLLYIFLAEAYYRKGENGSALQAAKKAYSIDPSDYNRFIIESIQSNRPIQ